MGIWMSLEKIPLPLTKWEIRLILRIRSLRNQARRGTIGLVWNEKHVSVVTPEKGLETLVTLKKS